MFDDAHIDLMFSALFSRMVSRGPMAYMRLVLPPITSDSSMSRTVQLSKSPYWTFLYVCALTGNMLDKSRNATKSAPTIVAQNFAPVLLDRLYLVGSLSI